MSAAKRIPLPPRLQAIVDLIPPGCRVVDVGTDHGYLPIHLRLTGVAVSVIATDLNPDPLDVARRNAARLAPDVDISFRLGDGLKAVAPGEVDTIVIAGMGGETIAGILMRAAWAGAHRLLLQPQSKIPELQQTLADLGIHVTNQHLVKDSGAIYTIYEAQSGVGTMQTPGGGAYYLHPALLRRGDVLLDEYLAGLCAKFRRALNGLAQNANEKNIKKSAHDTQILHELETWRKQL